MALADSSIAPSSDASAARSWGGTRAPLLRWRRASSSDCTMRTVMVRDAGCASLEGLVGDFAVENRRKSARSSTGPCRTNVRTRCNGVADLHFFDAVAELGQARDTLRRVF